jgi:SAM-dependent methyltransferase
MNNKPWHEKDDFWEIFSQFIFGKNAIHNASSEIEKVISLLNLETNVNILDLGCGIGRHSLEFTRRGFHVTGVDRTYSYLEKAKKKAIEDNLDVEFVLEDMRIFSRPNNYDVVINLFTSFSYFEDPEEDKKTLVNIYSSLKHGGKLVLEMMGKEVLARIFVERDWQEIDGVLFLEERKVSKNWSWMQNRWILIKDGEKVEYAVDHRLYSGVELANLLKEVGFSKVSIYGNLDGSAYDNQATRMVTVAEK